MIFLSFRFVLYLRRQLKRREQPVIAFLAQVKAVSLTVFFGKISPFLIHTEYPFPGISVHYRDFFSALVADDFFNFFCFFYLILAHTSSSCKKQSCSLLRLKYI